MDNFGVNGTIKSQVDSTQGFIVLLTAPLPNTYTEFSKIILNNVHHTVSKLNTDVLYIRYGNPILYLLSVQTLNGTVFKMLTLIFTIYGLITKFNATMCSQILTKSIQCISNGSSLIVYLMSGLLIHNKGDYYTL